jgi:hypothetical protein
VDVQLLYALPLEAHPDDVSVLLSDEGREFVLAFGGGNNDGGTYLGVSIAPIADGYEVAHRTLDDLNEQVFQNEEALRAFDTWLETSPDVALLRPYFQAERPALLIVADSD